jgi:N-formylglutamate amidohydrolase
MEKLLIENQQSRSSLKYELIDCSFVWTMLPLESSPVTISVPHDGMKHQDLLGFVCYKKKGFKGYDNKTWQLVKGIAYGVSVNIVRGLMPRHFLDYNRYASSEDFKNYSRDLFEDTELAYEVSSLKEFYDFYHDSLIRSVLTSKQNHGTKAKFFDFHGFKKQPSYGEYDVILGTANRRTLKSDADFVLAEALSRCGYKVFCPAEKRMIDDQEDGYDAGFTTRNIFLKTGVDSIQVETHCSIRMDEQKAFKFSADFAEIISKKF